MNRRTFLRSLATVCGATVVCPGELLKGEPEWMKWARYFAVVEARAQQQRCTNSILCGISQNFGGKASGYIITKA